MKKTIIGILAAAMLFGLSAPSFADQSKRSEPSDSYEPVFAENEDSGLSLSFSHSFVKVENTAHTFRGSDSYTIRMAKNEIEDCQFFLSAGTEGRTNLTAEISPFTNGNGNELSAKIYKEYYTNIGENSSGLYPDAIPPLMGSFDIAAGKVQAFVLQVKTLEDTAAGLYEAMLTVKDGEGNEIKKAKVFLKVWDFALSEETACSTAVYLDYNRLAANHTGTDKTASELYKMYYDYLLENRVSAFALPYAVDSENAKEYLNNPRVTSFKVGGFEYSGNSLTERSLKILHARLSANKEWLDKAYFYVVDEPLTAADIEKIKTEYDSIVGSFPSVQIMTPMHEPVQYNETLDGIEYVKNITGIWCGKPYAYTPREVLSSVPNARTFQTEAQDNAFGTYAQRMAEQKAAGKKVWWYVAWDPSEPYCNILIENPGISHRVLFWQQKQNNVDGFLYYYANNWSANYWDNTCTNPGLPYRVYGDGILLYDGTKVGIDEPVGSLRLEAIRDGIEDYQYLTMLEELEGRDVVDALISKVSTNTAQWTKDDDLFVQTRIELGDAVEKAVNHKDPCPDGEHQGGEATCTDKAVCEICGNEYGEIDPDNHDYVDGVCTRCGRRPGDANEDGEVNDRDVIDTKRYISNWKVTIDESLADVDGKKGVSDSDVIQIKRFISGWNVTLK